MRIQPWHIILCFAFIKFIIPFIGIDAGYELHRDEYLYLAGSRHPAWGYLEAPPLLAWLGRLSLLFGDRLENVRFWGAFFGALHVLVVGRIVIALGGRAFACFIAGMAFLFGAYMRMHILFQPNIIDIFTWTLASYWLIRLIQLHQPRYIYLLALTLTVGWYGKYSIIFYAIPLALAFLIHPGLRSWLRRKDAWISLALFLVLISPNLHWQVTNGFPVMTHMKLLNEQLLVHVSRSQFLAEQFLFNLPGLPVWGAGLVWLAKKGPGRTFLPLLTVFAGMLALLLLLNGKGYYSMGFYPVLMACGGVALEQWTLAARLGNRLLRIGLALFVLILGLPFLPFMLPFARPETLAAYFARYGFEKTGLLTWERGDTHEIPQDYADMLGWNELAKKTARAYHRLPDSIRSRTIIFGDQYAFAGPLNYYRERYKLPETYSDDASFVFWLPREPEFRHLLLIDYEPRKADDPVFSRFREYTVLDSMTANYARERGVRIMLYRNGDDSLPIITRRAINALQKSFRLK